MATTRRFSFRAVHSLQVGLHREKMHGHEYFLEVSFHSCEREAIERVVRERVLSRLHGHDLTKIIQPATGEVLVEWIHDQLAESDFAARMIGVVIQETRKNRFVSGRSDVRMV